MFLPPKGLAFNIHNPFPQQPFHMDLQEQNENIGEEGQEMRFHASALLNDP